MSEQANRGAAELLADLDEKQEKIVGITQKKK